MDPYTRRSRREGYRARSVYKLKQINNKYSIIKKGDAVLDLGSFPGSWLQVCKELEAGFILGVDYKPIDSIPGVRFLNHDINDDKIFDKISNIRESFDAVISDVAPKTTGIMDQEKSLDLSLRAYKVAKYFLRPGGNFLCKIFQTKGIEEFMKQLRKDFMIAKINKPEASKTRSYEVYMVAKNFKGRKHV